MKQLIVITCNKDAHFNFVSECGDLYEEEEETASLVQTAMAAGETTPPSSIRNLSKELESENQAPDDTKVIDR